MCGSIPAPMTAQPTMPSAAGTTGSGAGATTTPAISAAATTTTPATSTAGGGAPGKLPTTGGGASDGAANLQLQQTLTSLVQALTALTELLKNMPASAVNGTSGGGAVGQNPGQTPGQVPPGKTDPTQGGGPCDTATPAPLSGGGSTAADASTHAHAGGHH